MQAFVVHKCEDCAIAQETTHWDQVFETVFMELWCFRLESGLSERLESSFSAVTSGH